MQALQCIRGQCCDLQTILMPDQSIDPKEQVQKVCLDICHMLVRENDLPTMLQGICDQLLQVAVCTTSWLVLLEQEVGGVITAESGLGERFAPIMEQLRQGTIPECGQRALSRTDGGVEVLDTVDCALCGDPSGSITHNKLAVAIRCRPSLYGFLVLQLLPGCSLDPEELKMLQDLAASVSLTLRRLFSEEESKQREEELRHAEQRYELALHASQAGLWDWNILTGEMYTSPDNKEMLDYRQNNTDGGVLEQAIHPDDREKVMDILNEHLAGRTEEYRIEYRVREQDGSWSWYLDRGRVVERDEKNMPVRMTGTHQNITKQKQQDQAMAAIQKQMHDALDNERTFLQTVIDGAGDPVMAIDLDYTVLLLNASAAELARVPVDVEAVQTNKCYQLFHGEDSPCDDAGYPCPVREARKAEKHVKLLHNPYHGNGINNTFEIEVSPLRDSDDKLTGIIEVARDITDRLRVEQELRDSQSRLYRLAHHDTLTGLPNRLLFKDRLGQSIIRARRKNTRVAILFLDLDRFKTINDTLGHDVGDALLVEVAARLQRQCRQSDTVARLGGDEFVFILDDINGRENVEVVAGKIMKAMRREVQVCGHAMLVSTSIGIGIFPDDSEEIEGVIKCADLALYKAKAEGRSNFQFYLPEMKA